MIRYIGVLILLIPCTVTDLRYRLVPVWYAGIFTGAALVYHLFFSADAVSALLSTVLPGAAMGLVFILVSRFSKEALGMGDAVLILALGIWCGFKDGVSLVLFAFILAGLFGGVWILASRKKRKDTLPFVPFLLASGILYFTAGLMQGTLS